MLRKIRLRTNQLNLHLEGIPNELRFVEAIAKWHAETDEQLMQFYLVGVEAAKDLEKRVDEAKYASNVVWYVDQAIKRAKGIV
jgi:hypothetical protein